MMGMIIVGKLIGRFDARLIMMVGLGLTVFSLWQMIHFDLLMNQNLIIISGVIQGFGVGLVYAPLSTIAFSTLPSSLRNEERHFLIYCKIWVVRLESLLLKPFLREIFKSFTLAW